MRRNTRIITSVFVMVFLGAVNAQQEQALQSKPFEGIDIELNAEQARVKMLLLCFWDIQQRPSRNLLIELAGHKKELENKGVVVLLVHTSDIGAEKLKSWIDKNKIPYICGRITSDTQRVLYRWGVRGQPWLVLTDGDGAIRAGGFEL